MASLTTLLSTVLAGELVFDKRQLFELEETTSVEEALKVPRPLHSSIAAFYSCLLFPST